MEEGARYYAPQPRPKLPRWIVIVTIALGILLAVATVLDVIAWSSYSTVVADDRQKIVDASTNILTVTLEKLATATNATAFKKNLNILLSLSYVFSAVASLQSIALQSSLFCAPSSNATFHQAQIPANVTANYTISCGGYKALVPLVSPFLGGGSSIRDFMAAVTSVVTALMKLDNAIVADP